MADSTLTTITNSLRYAVNDHETPYSIDPGGTLGLVKTWINAGLQWINREVPHIEANAVMLPDGSSYIFDLSSGMKTAADISVAITDFMKLKMITVIGDSVVNGKPIPRHGRGIAYMREIIAVSGGIKEGTPNYYAMKGAKDIWLDRVKAAPADPSCPDVNELFTIDYWANQNSLSAGSNKPTYPLNNGWHKLLVWASIFQAAEEIGLTQGDELRVKASKILFGKIVGGVKIPGELDRFRSWVAMDDHEGEVEGMIYSDLGSTDISIDQDYPTS